MKEAPNSPYAKLVFRETFLDEQSVRRNGGVPTDVTFEKGIGKFNGTSSYIKYNKNLNGVYSIRMVFKNLIKSNNQTHMDFRNSDGTGVGYLTGGASGIAPSSGTSYINAINETAYPETVKEIVITGITLNCSEFFVATRYNLINCLSADIDLVEIYQGTLTASEVKNLY